MQGREEGSFGSLPAGEHELTRSMTGNTSSVFRFDFRAELARLRSGAAYSRGDPTGSTLVKEPDLRIVLMALKAGSRMHEHDASGPISVQPIEGRIRLVVGSEDAELSAGEMVALKPGISHQVEALEDAAFLLTVGRTKYHDVSVDHEPTAGQ